VCLNLFAALPKVYYHRNCTVLKHCWCHFWSAKTITKYFKRVLKLNLS
jgi:hypothetical protein